MGTYFVVSLSMPEPLTWPYSATGNWFVDPDNAALSPQNDTRELDVPCIVTEDSVAVTAPRAESERWYAVIVGRQPGVHRG
jgi:hypothetical protein